MISMPLPKLPGTMAAMVRSTRGAKPFSRSIPTSGGGFPSPVPGMTSRAATAFGITAFGHDFLQQFLWDSEVEYHLVGHGSHTLATTRMQDTGGPGRRLFPQPAGVATVSGPWGRTHSRDERLRSSALATAASRSCTGVISPERTDSSDSPPE